MSEQKTILLISPYWREPHRWMVSSYKLAELWQRRGYNVVVACMGTTTSVQKVSDTLTVYFYKDIFLKDPWNYGICWGFGKKVLALAREHQPDIVIINKVLFWTSLAIFPLTRAGYRVILTTDALVGMTWWPRSLLAKIGAYLYAHTLGFRILRRAWKVIFFHPQPDAVISKIGIADRTSVIPTGIDPSSYSSKDHDGIVVTYVGRLESVKGVDDFLVAASIVKKQHPQVIFQVVGQYNEGHPLVRKYAGSIRFLGLRDDIPAILSTTDIFVLPSYSEGLSNALMEAMSSSCACIATAVGGNKYLIEDGVSGLLFPPGDRTKFAEHITQLCTDEKMRLALGKAARERIDAMFNWQQIGEQYETLFAEYLTA